MGTCLYSCICIDLCSPSSSFDIVKRIHESCICLRSLSQWPSSYLSYPVFPIAVKLSEKQKEIDAQALKMFDYGEQTKTSREKLVAITKGTPGCCFYVCMLRRLYYVCMRTLYWAKSDRCIITRQRRVPSLSTLSPPRVCSTCTRE